MKIIDFLKEVFGSKNFEVIAGEKMTELSLYRFALYNAVQIISSAMSRYEFEFQVNGKREENEDWFALNFEPNKNQSKQEFFYDLVLRLALDGEALCVDIGNEHFIADSFQSDKESCGFGQAVFYNIEKNGAMLPYEYKASEVLYFKLDNIELKRLLTQTALEFQNLLDAAGKKFKNSAYQKGILKIEAHGTGTKDAEDKQNENLNATIRKFYEDRNAVLPLKKNQSYEELGKYKNVGSTEDISSMTFQVYSRVAEAFKMSPYVLMHSSQEPDNLKADFYKGCVETYVDFWVREANRKHIGRSNYLGKNKTKIRLVSVRPWDVDELIKDGTAVYNLIGSGTVSIDEVRQRQGKEPLNTNWSKAHYLSLNLTRIENLQPTARKEE